MRPIRIIAAVLFAIAGLCALGAVDVTGGTQAFALFGVAAVVVS